MQLNRIIDRIRQRKLAEDTSCVGIFAEPGVEGGVQLTPEQQDRLDKLRASVSDAYAETLKDRYGEEWIDVLSACVERGVIKESKDETYFDMYSSAVQYALDLIPSNLHYDDDEYHSIVAVVTKKPGVDKTTSFKLPLYDKSDKHVKLLVVNVYNRGSDKKPYELNAYVS